MQLKLQLHINICLTINVIKWILYPDGTSTQQQMKATTLCVDILHQVYAELQYQIQQGFIDVHVQLTELHVTQATHYIG